MNKYWVIQVAFRDGTRYQGVTKYRLDYMKARESLLRELREYYPTERLKQKGGGIMKFFPATEKESDFSRTGHKTKTSLERAESAQARKDTANKKKSFYGNPRGLREENRKL